MELDLAGPLTINSDRYARANQWNVVYLDYASETNRQMSGVANKQRHIARMTDRNWTKAMMQWRPPTSRPMDKQHQANRRNLMATNRDEWRRGD